MDERLQRVENAYRQILLWENAAGHVQGFAAYCEGENDRFDLTDTERKSRGCQVKCCLVHLIERIPRCLRRGKMTIILFV